MQEKMLKILEFDKIISKLTSKCSSSIGLELSEHLLPSTDFEEVKLMQRETTEAVSILVTKGTPPLGGIKDIKSSLSKAVKGSILNQKDLLEIAQTLRAAKKLKSFFSNITDHSTKYVVLDPLFDELYSNPRVEEKIFSCILNEEELSDTASPTLHSIRRQILDSEQRIKDKLNSMIHSPTYQKYLQENLVTQRGERYVLPVKQEYRNEISGLVHDASSSGATLFIEPMAVVEANNAIKQLRIKESIEIERILAELTVMVVEIYEPLTVNITLLAKIDFIFAKGQLSLEMNATHPTLNQKKFFHLKNVRHPLIDPAIVVPINVWCGKDFTTLVITGPNTGGKTVTLKTVGLITLMAQAGLHIPANDHSEVAVFEKIFADIGDEQSIQQSLSTFSSHMKNIVSIIEQADYNSLVLLDELGSGTDPDEGSAIAMSILEYLHQKNAITIATTHYSQLKLFAINSIGVENASCEFDVQSLRPTFKLLIGIPGKSNAFAISQKLGLGQAILENARQYVSQENKRFEDVITVIEQNKVSAEKRLLEIEQIKQECDQLKEKLESERSSAEKQKEAIIKEARQKAKSILLETKEETDKMILDAKKLKDMQDETERNKLSESIKSNLRKKISETDESLAKPVIQPVKSSKKFNFKSGDLVFVPSLNQEGHVLTPTDENGNLQVQLGIMKLTLHSSQVEPSRKEKISFDKVSIGKSASVKRQSVPLELHVRGQLLDEALENTDRYLDDASLAGFKTVTIVHGKGTGTLRTGIHQLLKKHPHVKSFRLGKFGEGETGVTVVELS